MPEVDAFFADSAVWLWMMPWHGKWLLENNPPESLRRIYHDERTLTLDKIQDWK